MAAVFFAPAFAARADGELFRLTAFRGAALAAGRFRLAALAGTAFLRAVLALALALTGAALRLAPRLATLVRLAALARLAGAVRFCAFVLPLFLAIAVSLLRCEGRPVWVEVRLTNSCKWCIFYCLSRLQAMQPTACRS